jgi:hypothetical protein
VCTNIDDPITTTKNNGIITIDFTNNTHYTEFKTAYESQKTTLLGKGYINDPLDVKYYM